MNRYFYIDSEGKQKGTFSPEELKSENIKKDTLVWTQGMGEWMRASEVSELGALFEGSIGYYPTQKSDHQASDPKYQQPIMPLSDNVVSPTAPIMSVKDWLITYLIMIIPIANIVFLFIWAFGNNNENPNKVSWAKASLILMAIILGINIVIFALIMAFVGSMGGLSNF